MPMLKQKDNKQLSIHSGRGKLKLFLTIFLSVLVVATAAFLGYAFLTDSDQAVDKNIDLLGISTTPVTEEEVDSYQVSAEDPRYISISAVGINKSRVKAIGLKDPNSNGQQQMDEPDNIGDAGWYNCQINPVVDNRCDEPTRPGGGDTETSVVIDGHTCFSDRLTCIFDNLDEIESGDVINIELGNGEVIKYATRKVETVYLEDIDMNEAMRPIDSDKEGLLLITCSGTYNGATDANGVQTASQRMLVYAVREE